MVATHPRTPAAHEAWLATLRPQQRGFANTQVAQWPAGLRQVVNGQPAEVTRDTPNGFLEPYEGDCIAATTARRLAPLRVTRDIRSNTRRLEFLRVWWGLFNTPGLFARIARELNLSVGDRELEHFPVLMMVRWAMDHGIGPSSRVVTALEEYAPHTLAHQTNLGLFPLLSVDDWVHKFRPQLRDSHTLRYPPPIDGASVITTSSELQLLSRVPAAGATGTVPTAVEPVSPAVPAPSTLPPADSVASSAATDVGVTDTATAGQSSAPSAQDVEMDNEDKTA